jgi:DNA-binding transcriptional MerR regulator
MPDRRVLFYTEQNMLPGFQTAVGRGASREYSLREIFYLLVVKELQSLGLPLSRIRLIIMALHVKTLRSASGPLSENLGRPIWKDGTLAKGPIIMVVSFPKGPEEHALHPRAKGYEDELFLEFHFGSTKIEIDVDRPSKIVANLQEIFSKARA